MVGQNVELERRNVGELKESKVNFEVMVERYGGRGRELQHCEEEIGRLSHVGAQVFRELESSEGENLMLKEDFKKLKEMTNSKVNELDSKLIGLERIKEHERENHVLENDTVEKELHLCFEDMDKDFKEKSRAIESR